MEAVYNDNFKTECRGSWEIMEGPYFKNNFEIDNRLSLSIPNSGGIWKINYLEEASSMPPTTIYIMLPLAGTEISPNLRSDLSEIERIAQQVEWNFYNPVGFTECLLSTFYNDGRGDFYGMSQPFFHVSPEYLTSNPRPKDGSPWEINFPRKHLLHGNYIYNTITTWYGIETDTATLNYFYVGNMMGHLNSMDSRYLEVSEYVLGGALLLSRTNILAKTSSFLAGMLVHSQNDYDKFGYKASKSIYNQNYGEVNLWMDMMVPNLATTENYFLVPPCNCEVINIHPPLFIYLTNEQVNECNE